MSNKTPRYSLESIKTLISEGDSRITSNAIMDAAIHDMTDEDIKAVIHLLSPNDFYKSMQSHHNELIWQDVYHKLYGEIVWYIKLQIVDIAIVISFKEK
ncbi:MAG: motility quorum-sensing regulator/GCU-specific mRNA interferase toxin [Sulfurimonas sp.]|jgi:motility quorum-sensing regulator/GCU-specific mRNA interferase toxin